MSVNVRITKACRYGPEGAIVKLPDAVAKGVVARGECEVVEQVAATKPVSAKAEREGKKDKKSGKRG